MQITRHSRHLRPVLLVMGLIILGFALSIMMRETFSKNVPAVEAPTEAPKAAPFQLTSSAFKNLGTIPAAYTCSTEAKTPPLTIMNAPSNTKEFALVMRDTNSEPENKAHWVVWGIPATTTAIAEGTLPNGTVQGVNDESNTYLSPCPPLDTGEHTYVFELYALSDTISLEPTTTRDGLAAAINGKVISRTQLSGKVAAQADQ